MAKQEMVSVACKLPTGLIMELIEPPAPGSRQLLPTPQGDRYTLKGSNSLLVHTQSSIGPPAQAVHRYATTRVPAEFAAEWFKRNAGADFVKRGLVFIVTEDPKSSAAAIKERETDPQMRTGFEALVDKDPRMPTPRTGRNAVVADAESMAGFDRGA